MYTPPIGRMQGAALGISARRRGRRRVRNRSQVGRRLVHYRPKGEPCTGDVIRNHGPVPLLASCRPVTKGASNGSCGGVGVRAGWVNESQRRGAVALDLLDSLALLATAVPAGVKKVAGPVRRRWRFRPTQRGIRGLGGLRPSGHGIRLSDDWKGAGKPASPTWNSGRTERGTTKGPLTGHEDNLNDARASGLLSEKRPT